MLFVFQLSGCNEERRRNNKHYGLRSKNAVIAAEASVLRVNRQFSID